MDRKRGSAQKSRVTRFDAAAEAEAWKKVSAIASAAYAFWKTFLALRRGASSADKLTPADDVEFMYAIRAVSWVESAHGTGAGVTAARDPMQCGNPKDAWWPQLAGTSAKFDRFVRGGAGSKNYDANELPGVVVGETGWETSASTANLTDVKLGHGTKANDNRFGQTISYWWAIPHLIWKINVKAGKRSAYQCGNVVRSEVQAGCVEYNGGGDPKYAQKIKDAYALFAKAPSPAVAVASAAEEAAPDLDLRLRALLQSVVSSLASTATNSAAGDRLFFPDGIRLIDLSIEIGGATVKLKVSGSTADSTASAAESAGS